MCMSTNERETDMKNSLIYPLLRGENSIYLWQISIYSIFKWSNTVSVMEVTITSFLYKKYSNFFISLKYTKLFISSFPYFFFKQKSLTEIILLWNAYILQFSLFPEILQDYLPETLKMSSLPKFYKTINNN